MEYKYQSHIDKLLQEGCTMPELHVPNGKEAFRFIFSEDATRNHLPVCIMNPKRILPGNQKLAGYSLSCFGDEEKAEARYRSLQKSFKLIASTIGNAMAKGHIENSDGMITQEDAQTTHFELFESITCNLHESFTLTRQLV